MQCYSELVKPSGVTHSLRANFISPDASNLIVARTSILQIFALKQLHQGQSSKLVLVTEFALSGTVTALARVKLLQSSSGGDALLVACRDAKLSLIEWDPAHHSISTISIHYYENHDLLLCPWTPDLRNCVSHLTADPSSRCAAYNFGTNNLAIIPFHQLGDDLAMDDFDDSDDEEQDNPATVKNGDIEHKTPYAPSFVLPLTVLDPNLLHPVDMVFLHGYREPTIGILFSTTEPSNNMAFERKDAMIYAVYTLDIEQKASTTLLAISKLPNDLHKVISLPLPIGGTLLIGGNEIMHIDQGGKINAVGVNEFAKDCTALSMADQSDERMRLEGCQIDSIGNAAGDMLMVLANGDLVVLSLRLDGRSVSGLSLRRLDFAEATQPILTRAASMSSLDHGRIFIGSEESDSLLLATSKKTLQLKRMGSRGQEKIDDMSSDNESPKDEVDDDDDLYADTNGADGHDDQIIMSSNVHILDSLVSIGPINDFTIGRPPKRRRQELPVSEYTHLAQSDLELALACCRGRAGSMAFLQHELTPRLTKRIKHENVSGVWSVRTMPSDAGRKDAGYHDTIILSTLSESGIHKSTLMSIDHGELEYRDGTDFDGNTKTIAVGRLSATNHTIQVSAHDIRVYDTDFGLSQIFPIVDEESGEIAPVVAASIVEPYVLFIREDRTFGILKADKNGELDEIELPSNVPTKDIMSANMITDTTDFFATSRYATTPVPSLYVILTILCKDGTISIFPMADLQIQVFQYPGLHFLPPTLSPDLMIPKHWKNPDEIDEVLLAIIGDEYHQSPHLIVRNTTGDVIVYEACPLAGVQGAFRFHKVVTKNIDASVDDESRPDNQAGRQCIQQLMPLPNLNGFRSVFVVGRNPAIVLKSASSSVRIHRFREQFVKSVSALSDSTTPNSLIYVDSRSDMNIAQLPRDTIFTLSNMPIRKVSLGEEVTAVAYHDTTSTYLLSTVQTCPFQLPQDDEWHPEWTDETTSFLPTTTLSTLKLVSASDPTRTISQYTMDVDERILSLKSFALEISEESHECQQMIIVGTAAAKGENVVTRGNIYIFSVAKVNPDPDIDPPDQEYDLKLKLITKEDVRGSVSAITSIGSQGFLLASQGQKAMVRGLKEDKTLLPVAFLDMRFHVSVAQELAGTGLTIMGDAFSGLWLMGYSEEPYKMQLLARDLENPEVIAADFLPDGKQLYILSSDSDGEIRVCEYDPENPKTERGSKLLIRSRFNTGSYVTKMQLIPRTPSSTEAAAVAANAAAAAGHVSSDSKAQKTRIGEDGDSNPESGEQSHDSDDDGSSEYNPPDATSMLTKEISKLDISSSLSQSSHKTQQILTVSQTGAIALITPLNESSYRRLSTLQNILTTQLDHPLGLNPKAYRNVETDGIGGRGMIDGNIVERWLNLGSWHKGVMCGKVGGTVWEVRGDLEGINGGGAGLAYL